MRDAMLEAALKHLGASLASGVLDLAQYRRELAALLQGEFGCSRVGLWQILGEDGQRVMRCLARHEEGTGYSAGGEQIYEHEYQAYMSHLVRAGVYASSDTWNDPVLAGMREVYLVPANTRSMLDAAFTLNGRTFGVLCCEQTGALREWTVAEVTRLKRAAALITLHTARHERGDGPAWWDGASSEAA
jgi:GAF domain-containing protein